MEKNALLAVMVGAGAAWVAMSRIDPQTAEPEGLEPVIMVTEAECPACKIAKQKLAQAPKNIRDKILVVDSDVTLMQKHNITNIPTYYKRNDPSVRHVGVLQGEALAAFVQNAQ
jgi:hypothetical protein